MFHDSLPCKILVSSVVPALAFCIVLTWSAAALGRHPPTLRSRDGSVRASFPQEERGLFCDTFTVAVGDTTVEYRTQPAHLMLVNADPAGAYDGYYTNALDPLGVTWFTWHRPAAGTPPWTEFTRLRTPTVIWFSGDADTGTVPAADQVSLADHTV